MKTIIIAHPLKDSFSYAILKTLQETINSDIKVLDLYNEDMQNYLTFSNGEPDGNDKRLEIQKIISDSDEIICICPLWWGFFPAVMKNFFDSNFLIGYAFTRNEKGINIPLLKSKKLSLFSTCNSPASRYEHFLKDYLYLHFTECCGMKLHHIDVLGGIAQSSIQKREDFLSQIKSYYE